MDFETQPNELFDHISSLILTPPPTCNTPFTPSQEANPKPDLSPPSDKSISIIAAGIVPLGWSYDDLISLMFFERLATLQRTRPYAIAHLLPSDLEVPPTQEDFLRLLPDRVLSVLSAEVDGTSTAWRWGEADEEEDDVAAREATSIFTRRSASISILTMGSGSVSHQASSGQSKLGKAPSLLLQRLQLAERYASISAAAPPAL